MEVFEIVVVGMRFQNRTVDDVCACESFRLVPEPENQVDPEAVLVYGIRGGTEQKMGHVSRSTLNQLPDLPEQGKVYTPFMAPQSTPLAVTLVFRIN